jgi:hypothetical protein
MKVCVEAELDRKKGDVVLTLCDIRLRRHYMEQKGRHLASLSPEALQGYGFPMQFFTELKKGYPVRFRMNLSGFETLLGGSSREALGGLVHKESPPHQNYAVAQEEAFQARTQGAAEVWVEKRRDGWVVHSLVQEDESGGEFSLEGVGPAIVITLYRNPALEARLIELAQSTGGEHRGSREYRSGLWHSNFAFPSSETAKRVAKTMRRLGAVVDVVEDDAMLNGVEEHGGQRTQRVSREKT